MANPIQLKRNSVAATVPTSGQLIAGELAVNTADGYVFLKKDSGTIVNLSSAGTLNGATLASNVTASSLTSFGTSPALSGNPTATTQSANDNSTKIATTAYVDNAIAGLDSKASVAYASTAALPANTYSNGTSGVGATLTGTANGPLVIDGVTAVLAAAGSRVLVAGESSGLKNGWYTITQVGVIAVSPYILTRAVDSDQAAEIQPGYLTGVEAPSGLTAGSSNNQKVFISIAPSPFVVGTDTVTFALVGGTYTAGNGLTLTGTQFSIDTSITVDKTTIQTLSNKTLVAPALGTPASGVLTNCTGTAAGITAGNVTTNANLTGDVTSVGNATTLAISGVSASAYGSASAVSVVTFDAKGRATTAATTSILISESQVTNLVADLALKATIASPTFTGTVSAPTPTAGDNSTKIATTAFANTARATDPMIISKFLE